MLAFRLSSKFYLFGFFYFFLIKFFIFTFSIFNINLVGFGGGSDAYHYHLYALGYADTAPNIWPIILKWLKSHNLYSRDSIKILFFILSSIAIPFITFKSSNLFKHKANKKIFWLCMFFMGAYPTVFFFSLDIYRDTVMLLILMLGILTLKYMIESKNLIKFITLLSIASILNAILFLFRGYLGAAFTTMLILYFLRKKLPLKNVNKITFKILIFAYLSFLMLMNYFGFFSEVNEYRDGFQGVEGGSNLGITFDSLTMFIPNFILSAGYQLFGLWLFNIPAIFAFFTESIPFIFAIWYVTKNIKYADDLSWLIIAFFVVYSSIWIIGNDNLGTAVRIRILSYTPIFVAFLRIYQNKNISMSSIHGKTSLK